MEIKSKLLGKFKGMMGGARVYQVKRGHWQIQHPTRPGESCYDGTLKELERASKSKFVRFYS